MFDEISPVKSLSLVLSFVLCVFITFQCTTDQADKNSAGASEQQVKKAKENTPELADAMGQLQIYFHKYALAVDANNHELATFYFHEVRAAADGIKKNIPGYEGYDIKKFMTLIFDPSVEPVEKALANKNWDQVRQKTIELSNSCNSCHNATGHGFIEITPGFNNNPFNQDFSAPE